MTTQIILQSARNIVRLPFGPPEDGYAPHIKAPSFFATFTFNGKQYRTSPRQETFTPIWGDRFVVDLEPELGGEVSPPVSFVTLLVVDAATNKTHAGVDIDLAQSYEGPVQLDPEGIINLSIMHLPAVNMHVPGWPVYSVAPLASYRGTVTLPADILEGHNRHQSAVYTEEGRAFKAAVRRNSYNPSRQGTPQREDSRYGGSRADGSRYNKGSRSSQVPAAGVYGAGSYGSKMGSQGDVLSKNSALSKLNIPEDRLRKILSKFENTDFSREDAIKAYTTANQDLNGAIDYLVDIQVKRLVQSIGPENVAKHAQAMEVSAAKNAIEAREEHTFIDFVDQDPPVTHPKQIYGQSTIQKAIAGLQVNHTGRKKALLVGVNYYNSKAELAGCVADVKRVRNMITNVYAFPDVPERMTVLTDDNRDRRFMPTRKNILNGFQWLVHDAQPGDALFFHFSGHGAQVPSTSGSRYEVDGLDETILPSDWDTKGTILDEEIHECLVQPLPDGVKLTCFMDCCHSATMIDLSHRYDKPVRAFKPYPNPFTSPCDSVLISGSQDNQTSADVGGNEKYEAGGAMTMTMINTLMENPYNTSYNDLMQKIHSKLERNKFPQRPQLSSTQEFDTRKAFSFVDITPNQNELTGRVDPKQPIKVSSPKQKWYKCGGCGESKVVVQDWVEFVYSQLQGQSHGLKIVGA